MEWCMPASPASSEESCRHVEEDTIEHCAVSQVVVNAHEREWQMPTDSSDDATGGAVPSSRREVCLAEFPGKLR